MNLTRLTKILATEFGNSTAVYVNVDVIVPAFPAAWTIRMAIDITINEFPAGKYSKNLWKQNVLGQHFNTLLNLNSINYPDNKQQTPPMNTPDTKANRTPITFSWENNYYYGCLNYFYQTLLTFFPMNGVTRKDVRQLVPMINPYVDAVAPLSSAYNQYRK